MNLLWDYKNDKKHVMQHFGTSVCVCIFFAVNVSHLSYRYFSAAQDNVLKHPLIGAIYFSDFYHYVENYCRADTNGKLILSNARLKSRKTAFI